MKISTPLYQLFTWYWLVIAWLGFHILVAHPKMMPHTQFSFEACALQCFGFNMSKSISCNQYLFIWWRKHQYDCILWHEKLPPKSFCIAGINLCISIESQTGNNAPRSSYLTSHTRTVILLLRFRNTFLWECLWECIMATSLQLVLHSHSIRWRSWSSTTDLL